MQVPPAMGLFMNTSGETLDTPLIAAITMELAGGVAQTLRSKEYKSWIGIGRWILSC